MGREGILAIGGRATLYGWRTAPRLVASALAVSLAAVAVPIAAVAVGLVVFPIDFALKMIGVTAGRD